MDYRIEHSQKEKADRRKSAVITLLLSALIFLGIYFYKFTKVIPVTQEVVTTMLINFGDQQNGNGLEEPANQEGSLSSSDIQINTPAEPEPSKTPEKSVTTDRVITGNNTKTSAVKTKTTDKTSPTKTPATKPSTTATKSTAKKPGGTVKNATTGSGDGRGNAAIGSLIRGRGNSAGSQGDNGKTGNAGDPLGGDGNGDSKIGIDRKLIGYIPGTMGRGGSQPSHSCTASGTITIAYTVDKAGNVVSARRSGGISDPCVTSTSISWVKKYVKAEKASTSSTGSYRITF